MILINDFPSPTPEPAESDDFERVIQESCNDLPNLEDPSCYQPEHHPLNPLTIS